MARWSNPDRLIAHQLKAPGNTAHQGRGLKEGPSWWARWQDGPPRPAHCPPAQSPWQHWPPRARPEGRSFLVGRMVYPDRLIALAAQSHWQHWPPRARPEGTSFLVGRMAGWSTPDRLIALAAQSHWQHWPPRARPEGRSFLVGKMARWQDGLPRPAHCPGSSKPLATLATKGTA